jgi:hypothetical protein
MTLGPPLKVIRGQLVETHKDLAGKIAAMEKKYDGQFRVVFDAIRKLLTPPSIPTKRRIGSHPAMNNKVTCKQ